jgi:hypothetical protein
MQHWEELAAQRLLRFQASRSSALANPPPLATLFMKVPEVADLVAKELNSQEVTASMNDVEPAIMAFCYGPGGGIDRFRGISDRG